MDDKRVMFTMTKKEVYLKLKEVVQKLAGVKSVLDLSNQRMLVLKAKVKQLKGALKKIKHLAEKKDLCELLLAEIYVEAEKALEDK